MLTRSMRAKSQAGQNGVVLLIALIVLVAMTLAGIALVRSVDTTNVIAGNMAFQQSATQSGDTGVEAAITWLAASNNNTTLNNDSPANAYTAAGIDPAHPHEPAAGQSWDAYWTQSLASGAKALAPDASGNTVSYVIHRLCASAGSPTGGANCSASPLASTSTGGAEESGDSGISAPPLVYYRITSRIVGPRNTVSYVQAVIAM